MAKERITLLADGGKLIYTLGAISDTSNDVLVLEYPIFKSGSSSMFEEKDLVSKIFDKETFSQLCNFSIKKASDLRNARIPKQPYKLEIGSQVRFEKKSYDVIGFFYNTFAQLNIISPILFNYSEIIIDVNALLFALKSNTEIEEIINENIREQKYDDELNFPFLAGISNFKEYFSKIVKPPFTTLETIKIKQDVREIKEGEEIIPLQYDGKQILEDRTKQALGDIYDRAIDRGLYYGDKDRWVVDWRTIDSFSEALLKIQTKFMIDIYDSFLEPNFTLYTENKLQDLKLPFEFFNAVNFKKRLIEIGKENNDEQFYFKTDVGRIPMIFKGFVLSNNNLGGERFTSGLLGTQSYQPVIFGIDDLFADKDNPKYNYNIVPPAIFNLIFENNGTFYNGDPNETLNSITLERYLGGYGESKGVVKTVQLVLENNTYYGDFFVSSGNPYNNSSNNEKILPFGSIVKLSGVYWYILKYISTDLKDINNLNMCLCAKASTREEVLGIIFKFSRQTDFKGRFKFIETEKLHKAFQKNGFTPTLPLDIFSKPRNGKTLIEKTQIKEKVVSDLFIEKRFGQLEVLNKNFPQLNDTFIGILDVLDKKIRKPKRTIKKSNTDDFVYCLLDVGNKNEFKFYKSYRDEEKEISNARDIFDEVNTNQLFNLLATSPYVYTIPTKIKQIAFSTSLLKINMPDNTFVFSLDNYQQYQELLVTRTAYVYKITSLISEKNKLVNRKNGYSVKDNYKNEVNFVISNNLNPLSSKFFFRNVEEMFITSKALSDREISRRGDDKNFIFSIELYAGYRNNIKVEWATKSSTLEPKYDSIVFGQFSFVFGCLVLLFENLQSTALLHLGEKPEQKIKNLGVVQFLQQFDLNINLSQIKDGLDLIQLSAYDKVLSIDQRDLLMQFGYSFSSDDDTNEKNLSEAKRKIKEVLKNNNSPLTIKDLSSAINTSYQFKEKDDLKPLDGLLILIKLMDKVYFNLLDLTNKIKLNNKQSLLQNFPKIEEDIEEIEEEITDVEEDIFTEDEDIFEEALQELGDEFLDKEIIEEIENIDISEF